MSVLAAALITFFAFLALSLHLSRDALRRIAGYAGWIDLIIHTSVFVLFMGTSTLGLLQAELSALMFTFALRTYRWAFGYSRLRRHKLTFRWVTTRGYFA